MRCIAVDDEPFALSDTVKTIRDVEPGIMLHEFRAAAKALEFAEQNRVDVAFLDIEMGGMNGLELAKKLKDIYGNTNIIFVTGYSEYALDAFSLYASGYLLKPVTAKAIKEAIDNLRVPLHNKEDKGLRVQTFGNFEVFMDGKPVSFPRSKSKELFAYLISKRGTGCGSKEIAAVLFEDQPYNISMQKRVQTIISVMIKTLREAGAPDIIVKTFNNIAVDVSKVSCDYYRFMEWDSSAVNEYAGEYMANYSWAEFMVHYLENKVYNSRDGQ